RRVAARLCCQAPGGDLDRHSFPTRRSSDLGQGAGELDWQAIGGTWGCATSNVGKWQPEPEVTIPYPGFESILRRIAVRSDVLSRSGGHTSELQSPDHLVCRLPLAQRTRARA